MKEQKSDYENYLAKYMTKHQITREEAEKHLIVMAYRRECEKKEDDCEPWKTQE